MVGGESPIKRLGFHMYRDIRLAPSYWYGGIEIENNYFSLLFPCIGQSCIIMEALSETPHRSTVFP